MGGVREDVQRARSIIAEKGFKGFKGFKGLFEALARGELLPATLMPLGLAGSQDIGSSRE
jgi:hypothetical protein